MDLLHTYNDMAGRICKMWRDYSYTVRPYVLTVEAGGRKRCGTYRTQEEAEHAAAHFMATGELPAAAEGSGVPSPKPETDTRLRATGEPGSATPRFRASETPALQQAREGVDGVPGA